MSDQVSVATCWPVRDEDLPARVAMLPVSDDGRGEWHWLRTADGDLFLALAPTGEWYVELSDGPAADDYEAALKDGSLHEHEVPKVDVL